MSAPLRRWAGTHRALGVAWPPGEAPAGAAAWEGLARAGDRVFDLVDPADGAAMRVLWFGAPREASAPPGADLLCAAPAGGASALDRPGAVGPGRVELGRGGRRVVLARPDAEVPAVALLGWGPLAVTALAPVGVAPEAPAPPADFAVLSARLGLGDRPGAGAAATERPGRRARVGDWLAAWGGRLVGWLTRGWRGADAGPPRRERQVKPVRPLRPWQRWGLAIGAAVGLLALLPLGGGPVLLAVLGLAAAAALGAGALAVAAGPAASVARAVGRLLGRVGLGAAAARVGGWLRLPLRWRFFGLLEAAHARALEGLVRRFAGSDLLDALRHAIPLGGAGDAPPTGWFLGRFGPRGDFSLTAPGAGGGAVTAASAEVLGLLRRLYEDAHTRLDADGDVERAAWVLAELLRAPGRAVAYLEARGRVDLAAAWAQALGRPTPEVLRLLVAGGAVQAAADLARARGFLAEGITLLDRAHPEVAGVLRLRLARERAAAGAHEAAVRAVWPLRGDAAVPLRAWLAAAGAEGPWLQAAALVLDPPEDPRALLRPVLDAGPVARRACARALLDTGSQSPAVIAPVLRALLPDAAVPGEDGARARALVQHLLHALPAGALPLLRADLSVAAAAPTPAVAPRLGPGLRRLKLPPGPGAGPWLTDALLDADGVLVAAAGDLGLLRWTGGGTPQAQPVAIVSLVDGGAAGPRLGLGPAAAPGAPAPLYRLAPGGGPAHPLGPAPRGPHLDHLDAEGLWWCADGDRVCAFQPTADGLRRVWDSGRLGGPVLALGGVGATLRAVVAVGADVEAWRWDRSAGPTLRERRGFAVPAGQRVVGAGVAAARVFWLARGARPGDTTVWVEGPGSAPPVSLGAFSAAARLRAVGPLLGGPVAGVSALGLWSLEPPDGAALRLAAPGPPGRGDGAFAWRAAPGGRVLLADAPGRVLLVDPLAPAVLEEWRA